jgi:putative ABC transport system ATP-binding protein
MSEPFICISDLRKSYFMGMLPSMHWMGSIWQSKQDHFDCHGPFGLWKDTLLSRWRLDRPTEGHIEIDGQAIEALDENALAVFRRRQVGLIFQSFNLIQSMTALENVAFPLQFARVPHKHRHARALDLLQKVGLQDRALHKPTELSGGEQQRVAIARALVNDPELILADEPTGNLDTASGIGIMQLLSEFHRGGRTVIGVTHDARMQQFATDTVQLLDGRIVNGGDTNNPKDATN